MPKEENIELVRRFFEEVYSQGNEALANEILAPDFSFYGSAAGIHSPDNFIKFTVPMRNGLRLRFNIEAAIGDGEKVATYSRKNPYLVIVFKKFIWFNNCKQSKVIDPTFLIM